MRRITVRKIFQRAGRKSSIDTPVLSDPDAKYSPISFLAPSATTPAVTGDTLVAETEEAVDSPLDAKAQLETGQDGDASKVGKQNPPADSDSHASIAVAAPDDAPDAEATETKEKNASEVTPSRAPSLAAARSLDSSLDLEKQVGEDLWERAYDNLRAKNAELSASFQTAVESHLHNDKASQTEDSRSVGGGEGGVDHAESVNSSHPSSFQRPVDPYLDLLLKRILSVLADKKNDSDNDDASMSSGGKESTDTAMDSLQSILQKPLERSRVSLPWAAAYLMAEAIFSSNLPSAANHQDSIEVVAKLEWYINLARLVVGKTPQPTRHARKQRELVVSLYELVLRYMMQRQSVHTVRKELLADNATTIEDVRSAEEAVLQDLRGSATQEQLTRLLANTPKSDDDSKSSAGTQEDRHRLDQLRAKLNPILPAPVGAIDEDEMLQGMRNWGRATREGERFFRRPSSQDGQDKGPSSQDGQDSDQRDCCVLWLLGSPGCGKTTLMRALMADLLQHESGRQPPYMASFFLDDQSVAPAPTTQILKSLIWQMIESQPSLTKHMEKKFITTGRTAFDNTSDLYALSTVLNSMVSDDNFGLTYVFLNAVETLGVSDEPDGTLYPGRPSTALLDFMKLVEVTAKISPDKPRIKWMVSIDCKAVDAGFVPTHLVGHTQLNMDDSACLESTKSVFDKYIARKVADLTTIHGFKEESLTEIRDWLYRHAPHNFLWVDVVCRLIAFEGLPWNACQLAETLPRDVPSLYREIDSMLVGRFQGESQRRQDIMTFAAVAGGALHTAEVGSLLGFPPQVDVNAIVKRMCLFFLEIHDHRIRYVHAAARNFVLNRLAQQGQLSWTHFRVTVCCLKVATHNPRLTTLPKPYATTAWIRHLSKVSDQEDILRGIDAMNQFFNHELMPWLDLVAAQGLSAEVAVSLQKLYNHLHDQIASFHLPKEETYLQTLQQVHMLLSFHLSSKAPKAISPKYCLPLLFHASELREKFLPSSLPWLDIVTNGEAAGAPSVVSHILTGHDDWVRCCAYSPNGRLIASGGDDGRVRLWDTDIFQVQHVFVIDRFVYCVLFLSDELMVACTSDFCHVLSVITGEILGGISAWSEYSRQDVHVSPDGTKMVAVKEDGLSIFDVSPYTDASEWAESSLRLASVQDPVIRTVRFSPDMSLVAYTTPGNIYLHSLSAGAQTGPDDAPPPICLTGHNGDIDALAFRSDTKYLASGSDDETVRVWETRGGTWQLSCVLGGHSGYVHAVSFSPDGLILASASSDETIRIWAWSGTEPNSDTNSDKDCYTPKHVLRGHSARIYGLSFSPHGQQLVSASIDSTIRVWDMDLQHEVADGRDVGSNAGGDAPPVGHSSAIRFVAFSPSEHMFATGGSHGDICLWQGDTGKLLASLRKHTSQVLWLSFSVDGHTLVSTSTDCSVCVWDTDSGALRRFLPGHEDWVRCAVISPDGTLVASGSDDRSVRMWDIARLPSAGTRREEGAVADADADADAELDSTANKEYNILLGKDANPSYIMSVVFSPSGKYLASGGNDSQIRIWDVQGLKDGRMEEPVAVLQDVSNTRCYGLAFTQDETRIVSGNEDAISLWHWTTGVREYSLPDEHNLFDTIQIDERSSPAVLITELGAWPLPVDWPHPLASPGASLAEPRRGSVARLGDAETAKSPDSSPLVRDTPPDWRPYGINSQRNWITWYNEKAIFLPTHYRPRHSYVTCRVQDKKLVIGCDSGEMLFFKFAADTNPEIPGEYTRHYAA